MRGARGLHTGVVGTGQPWQQTGAMDRCRQDWLTFACLATLMSKPESRIARSERTAWQNTRLLVGEPACP